MCRNHPIQTGSTPIGSVTDEQRRRWISNISLFRRDAEFEIRQKCGFDQRTSCEIVGKYLEDTQDPPRNLLYITAYDFYDTQRRFEIGRGLARRALKNRFKTKTRVVTVSGEVTDIIYNSLEIATYAKPFELTGLFGQFYEPHAALMVPDQSLLICENDEAYREFSTLLEDSEVSVI